MNIKHQTSPIIRTKLYAPSLAADHQSRDRLIYMMDKTLEAPLTLVSAPAGYGKTVLVSEWVRGLKYPSAWLSLDEDDSGLLQFLIYLLAAVDTAFPGACHSTRELLAAPESPPPSVFSSYLINDLDEIDGPFVIVLDDYHLVDRSSLVHELIEKLLAHPPPRVHIVLIARHEPPLSLARLRAANCVAEIRLKDLRFSTLETSNLVTKAVGRDISEDALVNLQTESEGWAAALRLVLLAVRSSDDPDAVLKTLHGGVPQTQEYLLSEVLMRLPAEVCDYLLKSSILNRFCAEVIDAICTEDVQSVSSTLSGREFLELIQRENLFISSLDSRGQWFRFHHLFQHMLQRQLQQRSNRSEIGKLHLRASAWLEAHGQISDAIEQALAAGKAEHAAKIVEQNRHDLIANDKWLVVKQWLDLLPDEIQQQRPGLLLTQAWVAYYQLEYASVESHIQQIESLPDDWGKEDPIILRELDYLRGWLAFWAGDTYAAKLGLEQSLNLFTKDAGMIAGEIRIYLGMTLHMAGESERALALFQAEERAAFAGNLFQSRLLAAEGFVHLLAGRLSEAARVARRFEAVATNTQNTYIKIWSHYLQANPRFHAFELQKALNHFLFASERRNLFERKAAVDTLTGLALTYQWLQRPEDALRTSEELIIFSQEFGDSDYISVAESCQARLALVRDDRDTALHWARSITLSPNLPGVLFFLEEPFLTRARVQIAYGSQEEIREALDSLETIRPQLESLHLTCQVIEVAVLQSLALHKLKCADACLDALRDAIAFATPGGWIRPFVEAGPVVAELLADLGINNDEAPLINEVLDTFQKLGEGVEIESSSRSTLVMNPSVVDLTNRELDILEMLAQRLQNKEIASRLFVSTHTVNTHLKKIYKKLGATNRRQAVMNAVEKGVLPPL